MTDGSHLARIQILPGYLARWRENTAALGDAGRTLLTELHGLERDPTRHMLTRAAKAARSVQSATTGDAALIAQAIAIEIEETAK